MQIGGIQKFSTLDYPGKISAIVFCQGCSLRCLYCHNKELQNFIVQNVLTEADLYSFLDTRKGLLDAVVFSGGEPLLQLDLSEKMFHVKHFYGFLIGLHTSGVKPAAFRQALKYTDWVGFDVKTSFEKYENITKIPESGDLAFKSFKILVDSGVDFEIRTTYDGRFISDQDMISIASSLCEYGVKKWVIQECVIRSDGKVNMKLPLPDKRLIEVLEGIICIEIRKQ